MFPLSYIPGVLILPIIAAVLASVTCGVVGTLTVTRRDVYLVGAVSHAIFAGLGFSQFAQTVLHWEWFSYNVGAILTAVTVAVIIALLRTTKERQDSSLSAIWSVGMAIGLLFMAFTPGYQTDLLNYMFGTILLVSKHDITTMIIFNAVIIVSVILCWRGILAICCNSETAKLRGVNVLFFEIVLSVLTALAIVLLVRITGIVLLIALLALPTMASCKISKSILPIMLLTALITALSLILGLVVSYFTDLPPAALTVTITAMFTIVIAVIKYVMKKVVSD